MVRSDQQLIERMTLIWHSWFATSEEASNARLMIDQNWTLRRNALGNFHQLLLDVTRRSGDAAVAERQHQQQVLARTRTTAARCSSCSRSAPDRGYNQDDVHQNARALTGWTNDWSETPGR